MWQWVKEMVSMNGPVLLILTTHTCLAVVGNVSNHDIMCLSREDNPRSSSDLTIVVTQDLAKLRPPAL